MQVCMGIIRAILNYLGDLSRAVCIRLLFRTPSWRRETERHKIFIPLMYIYIYIYTYLSI